MASPNTPRQFKQEIKLVSGVISRPQKRCAAIKGEGQPARLAKIIRLRLASVEAGQLPEGAAAGEGAGMLRLQFTRGAAPRGEVASWLQARQGWLVVRPVSLRFPLSRKALKDESGGGGGASGGFAGQSWDPGLEIEVPFEQRPVNEYSSLKDSVLYSWGELSPGSFFLRLGGLWLGTFTVLAAPIAAASFNPSKDPLRFALAAGIGTLILVSIVVLRIYLGWSYVGDRLLSAVIPYEETGWYDGQMWVKPPEILARDRLLGSYKVKPVIKLLKQTLIGTGMLLVTAVSLFVFASPVESFLQSLGQPKEESLTASAPTRPSLKKQELLRLPVEVMKDDDLASAAAEAAGGRPVYCRDRFYRALAGGQYCKWDDLVY